ncbi:MAG TPA: hypothetical protein EYP85_12165 [Armatimonadetes bacterium]|nr:hypothetical protein [Armatimonadota bacterium]
MNPSDLARKLCAKVNPQRVAERCWELVNIPSPTGEEKEVAVYCAEVWRQFCDQVLVDETFPTSPSAAFRWGGKAEFSNWMDTWTTFHGSTPHRCGPRRKSLLAGPVT